MKQSIRFIVAACAVLVFSYSASASHGCGNPEKLQREKIAYITTELDLTSAEAEKFWPVYNEVSKEKKEAMDAVKRTYKALKSAIQKGNSDASIRELTDAYLKANTVFQAIDAKSCDKFRNVLPESKVAKLYLAEEKFRRQQIDRLGKDARSPKGPKGPKGTKGLLGSPDFTDDPATEAPQAARE